MQSTRFALTVTHCSGRHSFPDCVAEHNVGDSPNLDSLPRATSRSVRYHRSTRRLSESLRRVEVFAETHSSRSSGGRTHDCMSVSEPRCLVLSLRLLLWCSDQPPSSFASR